MKITLDKDGSQWWATVTGFGIEWEGWVCLDSDPEPVAAAVAVAIAVRDHGYRGSMSARGVDVESIDGCTTTETEA